MVDKIKQSGIGSDIIKLWDLGYSGSKIAAITGGIVTGRSVIRYLNRNGIQTFDTRKDAICALPSCGMIFKKVRSVFLRSKNHYCTKEHYWKHLEDPGYTQSIHNSRMARKIIRSCGYYLTDEEMVHYIDGDDTNCEPSNMMVFANNSDLTRWLHGDQNVKSLWPEK